eukprot:6213999-Pleurochrysis_carterae.AAC.1
MRARVRACARARARARARVRVRARARARALAARVCACARTKLMPSTPKSDAPIHAAADLKPTPAVTAEAIAATARNRASIAQ